MSIRICIFIYCWRINWSNFSKFINWYYFTWYLLCRSSFSLCFIYRRSICNYSWINSMISPIYWINTKWKLFKNSVFNYIYWSKFNFFPPTLFRTCRNTTTIFRLSRRLHFMKYYFFNWKINFNSKNYFFNFYFMRKIFFITSKNYFFKYISLYWMTSTYTSCWT